MFFASPKKPRPLFPEKSPLENGYDMLRLFLGLGPPQQPDDRPLFQGLLYEPPVGKGLLNIPDPDAGPRPFPGGNVPASAPPAFGAWGTGPSFANAPQQSNPYAQGGLGSGAGADWQDEFSVFALDRPRSSFGSMQPPATRPIDEDLLDVPAYKRGYFRDHDLAQNWHDLNQGIDRMRDRGSNERLAVREIVAAEGGGVPDHSDPEAKGPAIAGITAKTLEELGVPGVEPGTLPADLKPWQWGDVYRAYFNREFRKPDGYKTLEQIKHPGVSAFVADTVFREGQPGVGMVQRAINKVRREQGLPMIDRDTIFGGNTLDALNQVAAMPEGRHMFAKRLKELRDANSDREGWRTNRFLDLATK